MNVKYRKKYWKSNKLVQNPNWWEADQLAIYTRDQGVDTRDHRVTDQGPFLESPGNFSGPKSQI